MTKSYIDQRTRVVYIVCICKPEPTFDLSVAAKYKELNKDKFNALNK